MESTIAVLIDFENIAAGTEKDGLGRFDVETVLKRVKDKGRVIMARSYGDWGRFARFKQSLLLNNVTMMELTSHGMQDKNRADIALVVDALELAFTKDYIDTYVIVSGDSDFTPLALKMRELDKRVIGCGVRSSTSRLLVQACDEFIFYDNIVKGRKRRERARQTRGAVNATVLDQAFHLLLDAVDGLLREVADPPHASVVKNAMQRKSPDFTEAELGFQTFGRFLEAAQKGGHVHLIREQKSGGYRVDQTENSDSSQSSSSGASRQNDQNRGSECWLDPYLPEGTKNIAITLNAEGINPLSAPTRKTVLDELEQSVDSRRSRKRRINVQFVQEDVRRRMRKTHPDVPAKAIRSIFNGLMRAGVLLHKDGAPVRTGSAPFHLSKDSTELNEALGDIYLDAIHHADIKMPPIALLADLIHGDIANTRHLEETLAYLQANAQEDLEDVDLDSLLSVDPTEEVAITDDSKSAEKTETSSAEEVAAKAESESNEAPKRGRRTKKTDETKNAAEVKKTTKAKKTDEEPVQAATDEEIAAAPVDSDAETPAPKKRKTVRKRIKKPATKADA